MHVYKLHMAYVGKILNLSNIPGADRIERCEVVAGKGGKWSGVTRKGDVAEGDKVIVFLPDAIVPKERPELAFMEQRGWRVRMMRLRGCPSEVLIMPANVMGIEAEIGTDVTDLLGVMKYEKEIPLSLAGEIAGAFPSFIPKTAEQNFQRVPEMRKALVGRECVITTKHNGTSMTFFHRDSRIGGCSRNWELRDKGKSAVWEIAHRHDLPERLPKLGNIALQWECVGPLSGIPNPLKLSRIEPRVFNVWDIDHQEYWGYGAALDAITCFLKMPFVEGEQIIYQDFSDDELRKMAEGVYVESGKQREGIVIRPLKEMRVGGERVSFKVLNLLYHDS